MSKYPCGLIEDLIPLYIEGDISNETKEIIKEHIKECENCSSLVNQYCNDELKVDDFKEDLPRANTLKKWMKRLKILGPVIIIVMIFSAIAIGVLGYKASEDSKNNLLTQNAIVRTLNRQGLSLKENMSKSPEDFALNGLKPTVYNVGKSKDTLLIYIFKSISKRDEMLRETKRFNSFSFEEIPYKAKNALIVYIPYQISKAQEEYIASIGKTNDLISTTVFKNLNDGKERVYKGESESWEGTFNLKYYDNWFEDENGRLTHDGYNWYSPKIRYKRSGTDVVGPITFEYKTPHGGGNSTGLELNKDGYANLGSSSGNGAMFNENDDISFTIKWADKEEHIELKAQ